MSITRGIDLVRNGKDVAYVSWKNWVFDAWFGEYLREVRNLPYVNDPNNPYCVHHPTKEILQDMVNVIERRQFEICPGADVYFYDDTWEQDYAVRYAAGLRELIEKYQDGDTFDYYMMD